MSKGILKHRGPSQKRLLYIILFAVGCIVYLESNSHSISRTLSDVDVMWDGPLVGFSLAGGKPGSEYKDLHNAQSACLHAEGCMGITGRRIADNSTETMWQLRLGVGLWLESSPSAEVSFRWRTPLSPGEACDGSNSRPKVSGIFYINLARRQDRREALLNSLAQQGVPRQEIAWIPGVDREQFEDGNSILAAHHFSTVKNWTFEEEGIGAIQYDRSAVSGERIKGKVGAWVAHLEALRAVEMSGSEWSLIIEDDVRLAVPWSVAQEQLRKTICRHADVDMVYLTGREYPNRDQPWQVQMYTGVDAYAVRRASVEKIIAQSQIAYPHVRALALDAHWSRLVTAGEMRARMLEGGQIFANRWGETLSDIEVK